MGKSQEIWHELALEKRIVLVKITIKWILIFLSNSSFNFFMRMENGKKIRFPFSYGNENQMKTLNIQSENLFSMKIIWILFFQFSKNKKWHFGSTDYKHCGSTPHFYNLFIDFKAYWNKYWENIDIDIINWKKLFRKTADHKHCNIPLTAIFKYFEN